MDESRYADFVTFTNGRKKSEYTYDAHQYYAGYNVSTLGGQSIMAAGLNQTVTNTFYLSYRH